MASRKPYEMLFALNAQMNGSFSSTLSKAQQEFVRLGKEIQGLSKIQSDISAYQKQQGAIDATQTKLNNLRQQEALLVQQLNAAKSATEQDAAAIAALEREKLKLEQRISNTNAALERQSQKLSDTGARLKEAGVDTANLSQKDAELTARIKELQAEQDKAAEGAASFGERSVQAIGAVQQALIAAGIAAALKKIADAYMECIKIAGDFEAGMSTVEALSGATAAEMEQLSSVAKELGATTKFTAQEAADAMGYMAMAGWDAIDMMNGMDGVMQLAAASGEDLAMVSDIVTDNLTAFGLTAADTAHFSDVLAAAATNSNTNVSIMGETFKQSASIAGALGYSIEDVAVAVGLMANSGVKGSIAGTALKNTFNGLLEGATLTGAAFGEYEYSAIKADGTMKSFSSTINELRVYFDQMTEAERVNNAMTIAGARGYNGLLAILNAADEDYASLTDSINNCSGAAQRMASIKLDNMNGQLTLMNSAWEALRTTIGEQFIPEMRGLYEIGTDVLTGLNEFSKANPGIVKGIAAGAAVIGSVTLALTAYAAGAKIAAAASALLSASIPGVNIIMGVTAALAGITAAVVAFTASVNEGIPSVKELSEAARDAQEAMEQANAAYDETATQTLATAQTALIYIDRLEEIEAAAGGAVKENQEYHNILALLSRTVPELADSIDLTNNAIDGGTEALRANTEEWKRNAEAQAYQEYLNSLYDQHGEVTKEYVENSIKRTQAEIHLEEVTEKRNAVQERLNELSKESYDQGGMLTQEYYDLQNSLNTYNDEIYKSERTIKNLDKAIAEDIETMDSFQTEIDEADKAWERITDTTKDMTEAEKAAAQQTQEFQQIFDGVTASAATLTEAYKATYEAAMESIQGQYALWDMAAPAVATSAGSINSALESQITYWQAYDANLQSLTERSAEIEGLSDVIASFADGSKEGVNAVAGLAAATDEELREVVANYNANKQAMSDASNSTSMLVNEVPQEIDKLQKELEDGVAAMNLGSEAAESARATIQGYIDGLDGMHPEVQAAFARFAQAVPQTPALPGNGFAPIASLHGRGYATGTESAEPGFALVGEKGPELIYFNGGEKVVNAAQTAAMRSQPAISALVPPAGGANSPVTIQVSFNIQGTASPETVASLQEFGSEFAEHVLDVIEQHNIDVTRRAYR
ncbi:phage tail tape measure protein [Anaerotruncus colihominis]|uniref:Phage tail tape measure protein n=1 Tax=Anaerotruncus colihominis TaxID=169435 RepID=A0A3E3IHX4_9FIRM|nr:phage tail tape measure protein [Anaerotruncus colihominis]RGE66689.1 phage tail tape measure protein [Anaerotruncus colihominis]